MRAALLVRLGSRPGGNRRWELATLRAGTWWHEKSWSDSAIPLARQRSRHFESEARARWNVLLQEVAGASDDAQPQSSWRARSSAADRRFEARALLDAARTRSPEHADEVARSTRRCASARRPTPSTATPKQSARRAGRGGRWCGRPRGRLGSARHRRRADRVGARRRVLLRDRLQASSVAFVARQGRTSCVLARVGSELAGVDLALRAMDAGVADSPADEPQGPVDRRAPCGMPRKSSVRCGAMERGHAGRRRTCGPRFWASPRLRPRPVCGSRCRRRNRSSIGESGSRAGGGERDACRRARRHRPRRAVAISGRHRRRERIGKGARRHERFTSRSTRRDRNSAPSTAPRSSTRSSKRSSSDM